MYLFSLFAASVNIKANTKAYKVQSIQHAGSRNSTNLRIFQPRPNCVFGTDFVLFLSNENLCLCCAIWRQNVAHEIWVNLVTFEFIKWMIFENKFNHSIWCDAFLIDFLWHCIPSVANWFLWCIRTIKWWTYVGKMFQRTVKMFVNNNISNKRFYYLYAFVRFGSSS